MNYLKLKLPACFIDFGILRAHTVHPSVHTPTHTSTRCFLLVSAATFITPVRAGLISLCVCLCVCTHTPSQKWHTPAGWMQTLTLISITAAVNLNENNSSNKHQNRAGVSPAKAAEGSKSSRSPPTPDSSILSRLYVFNLDWLQWRRCCSRRDNERSGRGRAEALLMRHLKVKEHEEERVWNRAG